MDDRAIIKIRDINGDKKFSLDALRDGLGLEVLVIGTADDCQIKVENPKVSEHHGCFFKQDHMWAYQDMDSEAGSSVDGEKIHSTWLSNGMRLILDSKQFPDSTIIEVEMEISSGRQLLPGEIPLNNGSAGMYGYAVGGTGGAGGGAGPNMGYGNGGSYSGSGDTYEQRFMNRQNTFGILAGICWGIVGLIGIIYFFIDFGSLTQAATISGGYGLLIWVLILAQICMLVGMVMLSVGLLSYNKELMSRGSTILAIGSVTTMVTFFLLLIIVLGGAIGYLFSSFESVALIISFILSPMTLVAQSKNFRLNNEGTKIYSRFYRPIIYYGITILLLIITMVSVGGRLGIGGSYIFSSLNNKWQSLVMILGVVFSGIFLHVDENPNNTSTYSMGGGYGSQGYGGPQSYGGQNGPRGW